MTLAPRRVLLIRVDVRIFGRRKATVPIPDSPPGQPPTGVLVPQPREALYFWEAPPLPTLAVMAETAWARLPQSWFTVYLHTTEPPESAVFTDWTGALDADAEGASLHLHLRELPSPGSGRWALAVQRSGRAGAGLRVSRCPSKPDQSAWIARSLRNALAGELVGDSEALVWEFARCGLAWEGSSGGAGSYHYLQVVGGFEAGR